MTRRRRITWAALVVVAAGVVVASSIAWRALPGWVERQVLAAIADAGLGPASVGETRVGLGSVALVRVRAGEGDLFTAERITANFGWALLTAGRVESLRVSGVRIRADDATRRAIEGFVAERDEATGDAGLTVGEVTADGWLVAGESGFSLPWRLRVGDALPGAGGPIEATGNVAIAAMLAIPHADGRGNAAHLTFDGSMNLDAGVLARSTLTLSPYRLVADTPAHAALRELLGWSVTGELALAGELWTDDAGDIRSRIDVRVSDAAASDGGDGYALGGVAGVFTVTRPWPLQTTDAGRITWKTLTIGEVVFEDGMVDFEVVGPRKVRVTQAVARLGEGSVSASAFEVDPASPDVVTRVRVRDLELQQWLSLVTLGYLEGDGRVSGEVAVRVASHPRLRFALGEGQLASAGPGTFSLVDPPAAAAAAREQGLIDLENLDYSAEVRDRIVEALQAFAYDVLRFEFIRATDGVLMRLTTRGRGVRGARQEFGNLTVNVSGINELFDVALRGKLGMDDAQRRGE
jgi:hypothetical protein